jgi:hypothetical protein
MMSKMSAEFSSHKNKNVTFYVFTLTLITILGLFVSFPIGSSNANSGVLFVEHNLPAGTVWSITFNGVKSETSDSSMFLSAEPDTQFTFTVGEVSGYLSTSNSGSGLVNMSNTVNIYYNVRPTPTPVPTPNSTDTQTPTPTATSTSSPSQTITPTNILSPTNQPTLTPTPTIPIAIDNVTGEGSLKLNGNITTTQITHLQVTKNQTTAKTTLTFNVSGPAGTVGFSNITIPRTTVPLETNPTIYIDNQTAQNQGYTSDQNSFYVWFSTHFSEHQISIVFASAQEPTQTPVVGTSTTTYGIVIAVMILSVVAVGFLAAVKRKKKKV